MKRIMVVLVGLFMLGVSSLYAEAGVLGDLPIEVSGDIAFNSKYVWRGFLLDDDAVCQPGIYVSAYGFTASFWGSFDVDSDDALNSDEVDYSIDYTHDFDGFSVSLGHVYYDFPGTGGFSREYYLGVSLDTFLAPSLTWYHDYGKEGDGGSKGNYVLLALSHSIELGDKGVTLDLSGSVAYNDEFGINGHGGDAVLGMGFTIPLNETVSIIPNINYSIPFDDMKDSNDGNQDDEFYGGMTVAFSY